MLRIEAGADAQRFAPGVLPVDLIAFDSRHFQPEAVRTHVDDGKRTGGERIARHGGGSVAETAPRQETGVASCTWQQDGPSIPSARAFLLRSVVALPPPRTAIPHARGLPAKNSDRQGL